MNFRDALAASLNLLDRSDRRKLIWATIAQMATAFLDLAGIFLIGLVMAVGAIAAGTNTQSSTTLGLVNRLAPNQPSAARVAVYLAIGAVALLVAKSVISVFLTRRILNFLARRQAIVTERLATALLSQPILLVQRRSTQETAYALTTGVLFATLTILGQGVIVASEVALLSVLTVGLLVVSPILTLVAVVFFVAIALALHRFLSETASRLGNSVGESAVSSYEVIQNALKSYREIVVTHRRSYFIEHFTQLREWTVVLQADLQLLAVIPKYVFEIALVIGGVALACATVWSLPLADAIAIITVFLAAGSRVVPAILRLQVAVLSARSAVGQAAPTFALAGELGIAGGRSDVGVRHSMTFETSSPPTPLSEPAKGFIPAIRARNVCFAYPGSTAPALSDVSIDVWPGGAFAIVGPTGSGKSTLADMLIGVLQPDTGTITCGGLPPHEAVAKWPGSMAYVPQDVALVGGTVRENVALGLWPVDVDDSRVWEALQDVGLADFLESNRDGLNTVVGEDGLRLSGGQRQRLGIARAIYSRPRLLILDEATSALDAETESALTRTFQRLHGTVTIVTIAHRLATVVDSDEILYLEDGRVAGRGTFTELLSCSEGFRRQAKLLGLAQNKSRGQR